MHYEGALAIKHLSTNEVDVFDLTPDVLTQRWVKLITAFAFTCCASSLPVPLEYFGDALQIQRNESTTDIVPFYNRVKSRLLSLSPNAKELRNLILSVLKVRPALCFVAHLLH